MAFDPVIPNWIASYSDDGTDMTIPIASLSELSAAEADDATGDIRDLMFALCEHMFTTYDALDTADKPTKMTISKSISNDVSAGTATESFTLRFVTQASSRDVIAE